MHTVSENQCGKYALMLQQARTEAQADAATRFSSHLDAMIRHITKAELSRVEIVELLSQESAKFHNLDSINNREVGDDKYKMVQETLNRLSTFIT